MNRPFIIEEFDSQFITLCVPYNHLWNAEDCCMCIATFADKLESIGYDVHQFEQISHFSEDEDNLSSWVKFRIQRMKHLDFAKNLLSNIRKLTVDHPGHSTLPFSKRQLENIVI